MSESDRSKNRHRKKLIAARISDEGHRLLSILMEHYGLGRGETLEIVIREAARAVGVAPKPRPEKH